MWNLLKTTVTSFMEDEALSRGAAIAFYTVTSIAPILLIVIAVAGLVFGQEAAQNAVTSQVTGLMGDQTAEVLQSAIAGASDQGSGTFATIIGIVTLLATASGAFGEMQTALNKIWKAEPKDTSVSRLIRARAAGLGLVATLGFLLVVSLAVSAGLSAFGEYANSVLPFGQLILVPLNFLVSLALLSLLFAAIYKVLPDRDIAWRDVIVGAIVTGVLFVIGKSLIGWYLGSSAVASSYGAAGGLIILLFWVYYSTQIFLLGAEFTKVYATGGRGFPESSPDQPSSGTNGAAASSSSRISHPQSANTELAMTATSGHDPALTELEREAARSRVELMETVDALQTRLSPGAIKEDVEEYVRDTKHGLIRRLEDHARENPLQTVAIAAGLAYPLFRAVSAVPVPLLLIGAGAALSRRSSPGSRAGGDGNGFMANARETLGRVTDLAGSRVAEAKEAAQDMMTQAAGAARDHLDRASEKMSDMTSSVRSSLPGSGGSGSAARDPHAPGTGPSAADRMSSGMQASAEAAAQARERMMEASRQAQVQLTSTVQQHPYAVGAFGLLVGAAIAAALPKTRPEEKVFGAASREMMKTAERFAADGIDTAKDTARRLYEDATEVIAEKGLTADALRQVAEGAGEKLKGLSSDDGPRSDDSFPNADLSSNGVNARPGEIQ